MSEKLFERRRGKEKAKFKNASIVSSTMKVHTLHTRVGKGMEIPGAHLTVVEVFDVDSKNRCTFA